MLEYIGLPDLVCSFSEFESLKCVLTLLKMSPAAVSVPSCRLWSTFHEEVSPEPPHAAAQRRQTVQVSPTMMHSCKKVTVAVPVTTSLFNFTTLRCIFSTCTKAFLTSSKLKRHVGCAHAEKNKFFKVSLN